ncbi:MAG: DUF2029 domain-containing protein [Pirellulales bacterium]|nr:DUF2029 domain-containing protein [Pirellulales bacterium]
MPFRSLSPIRFIQRHANWLTSWPVFLLFFVGLCIWCGVDVRQRGYPYLDQPNEHKTDLTVYTEAGAAFFDGREPYEVSNIRGWTYLYPPLLAVLLAPLHYLPTQEQVTVWFFISVLFLWGIYREIGRIVRCLCAEDEAAAAWWKAWYPWLGVAAYCAAFLPTLNCMQRGQVGVLLLYFLLLGFRLVIADGPAAKRLLGGVVLALPIAVKIVPLAPVGFLLLVQAAAWLRRRRINSGTVPIFTQKKWDCPPGPGTSPAAGSFLPTAFGLALGGFLFLFALPGALVGWNANLGHLQTWSRFAWANADDGGVNLHSGNSHTVRNQSLHNAVYRWGNFAYHCCAGGPDDRLVSKSRPPEMPMDASAVGIALIGVRLAILTALLLVGLRLARQGDGLSLAAALGLGCAAMLVISPVSRGHYFLFLVPSIFFVPWWLRRFGGRPRAWIFAAAPVVMIDLHYFVLPISGRIGILGLGTTAWLLAALIAIARGGAPAGILPLPQRPPADALPAGKNAA